LTPLWIRSISRRSASSAVAAPAGRPAYHPGDLLKLYLYGYLNRVRSSRLLERETQRNLEVMWLLKKLTPDFKTIADFRKDNLTAIRGVCREFTLLCKALDLFGGEVVAIDGSKFQAVNNSTRNFTQKKVERLLAEIDAKIAAYLAELDTQDAEGGGAAEHPVDLQAKLDQLRTRQQQYQQLQQELIASGATQISLTDPDCRVMPVAQGTEVGYNVQTAVDAKHNLIVDHEVTNAVTDQDQLATMAIGAKRVLEVETLDVVTDMGYYDGEEVKTCLEAGITPYIAKPHTSRNQKQGLYTKADFVYIADRDTYRCPAGAELTC
jgi:transposase